MTKQYDVYTDGSDFKRTSRRLGIGGVLVDGSIGLHGKQIDEFSFELDRKNLLKFFGTDQCSNPFAEMVAVYVAIKQFSKYFKKGDTVVFHEDFIGCKEWIKGTWKTKEPYIKKITEEIRELLQKIDCDIEFEWVKGHQSKSVLSKDAYWNDKADKLAKGL